MKIFKLLRYKSAIALFIFLMPGSVLAQLTQKRNYEVIAYFSGDSAIALKYDYTKITMVIYSFGHVDSLGYFSANRPKDSLALRALRQIKQQYPQLKILMSMGGWGGCFFCSDVFADVKSTERFVASLKKYLDDFALDGIDLDWEYPAIENYPGHKYQPSDKKNFTRLLKLLRYRIGSQKIISFAAGGFMKYLTDAVEWNKIGNYVDYVNLMSYDLVSGYSTVTGHHTPLFSSNLKEESIDRAIQYFKKIKFPLKKIIVGAAFYTRVWSDVSNVQNGLYQTGKFSAFNPHKYFSDSLVNNNGFTYYWMPANQAAYWYNKERQLFATGDDLRSLSAKSAYIKKNGLGGIMFWELSLDKPKKGLLDAINLN